MIFQSSIFLLFFSCAVLVLLSDSCIAVDTIYANQAIKDDGNTIVSRGGVFELGFFSPGKSKNRYVGIWYKNISVCTPVWVANREMPIADKSGMFKVKQEGKLIIFSGGETKIWSSSSSSVTNVNPMARLLDTGNLVVWYKNSSSSENLIWQSFDYPGDTLLPGMKFGKDLVTGRERYFTSWKTPDDPSLGEYTYRLDTNGYPQILGRKGKVLHIRIGPWNGLGLSGLPSHPPNPICAMEFVNNQKEIYHKLELNTSVILRVAFTWNGKILQMPWIERIQKWVVQADVGEDMCNRYGLCGRYGSCNIYRRPLCSCMEGFAPSLPDEWEASDWSSGCQRKKPLDCKSGDGFRKISGVKLPDTRRSWYNGSMTLGECEMACNRNCSCTAYTNLDIRNGGSGCLLWFDELMDIREDDEKQDLYIKLAASELAGNKVSQYSSNKNKEILMVVLSSTLVVLLLFVVAYACKKKRPYVKRRGSWYALDKKNNSIHREDIDELPFFSLYHLAKATENFSISNKIGEGGFGPVYKGVLEGGQEIAVKRLSKSSQQGFEEFKNEIVCIAKLQHRNLVKLLGYCIHENDMILIYEYMTNNSLDSFIFDESRNSMLDWPRRFHIIHGMARGILYLHQDSRLQIIHRDLKAGNILLDKDMSPKISDFGLARNFVGSDTAAMTKKVVGTHGYISPEYALYGRFSIKSDVFSFGVIVLEIVSGRKNREFAHEDHYDNLLGHAWRLYKENRSTELMSASLRDSCIESEVLRAIHVGLLCVQQFAKDRPTMLSVVLMLVSESVLPEPKQPAFFNGESFSAIQSTSSVNESTITQVYAR